MMPVVRISDDTWERLKAHARPLEDTADDVVRRALDALEASSTKLPASPVTSKPKSRRSRGDKLPQKEFRAPLLEAMAELGGKAQVAQIRNCLEPKVAPKLRAADYEMVSSGEQRWWNAACWERLDMIRDGLMEPSVQRGVWSLSEKGLKAAQVQAR